MTRILIVLLFLVRTTSSAQVLQLKDGDIIFHTSKSPQSQAIQLATHSKYSHCGMILWRSGRCFVAEASKNVVLTPLHQFITRGSGGHYVVKRLRDEKLFGSTGRKRLVELFSQKFEGKKYDYHFEWTDEKIYCSELVWKLYDECLHVKIGKIQQLNDFDLTSDLVRQKMKERYGENIPLEEKVISPASIFESDQLELVVESR